MQKSFFAFEWLLVGARKGHIVKLEEKKIFGVLLSWYDVYLRVSAVDR
jgi:hypothetical protein